MCPLGHSLSRTPVPEVFCIEKFLLWLNCTVFLGAVYAEEHHRSAKALNVPTSNLLRFALSRFKHRPEDGTFQSHALYKLSESQ